MIQQGEVRGAEMFALDLSGALARTERWDVSLVSLFGVDQAYAGAAARAGVPVAAVQSDGRASGFSLRLAQRLLATIERGRFQIVQANGAATLKYLAVARRMARRRWGLVYRAIGMGSYWRRGGARRTLYRWLFAQPDRIVAVSRAVAEDLRKDVGGRSGRVVMIPNGIEPARLSSDPAECAGIRAGLGVRPGEYLVIYAGNLAPEKNLTALLNMVTRCRDDGLPVKALLVGEGRCREQLQEDVRQRGLDSAVRFLPPQENVGRFLAAADLCVLPSMSEGMPALLIEAGFLGVPSVAYAVGGIPEVVEHGVTGLLVGPNDEARLTATVSALLQDQPRRRAMGAAAAARYRRFEIAGVARQYSEMYHALLRDRGCRLDA